MDALVLERNGVLRLHDRPFPELDGRFNTLVEVAAVGVCGSDIPRAFEDGAYHYPLVLGHEFSAVVREPAPGGAFRSGDPVAVFPLIPNPGEAINQIGEYAVATRYDYFGSRRDGAFQRFLAVPEDNLVRVPASVSLSHAAMTEPCAVAYHASVRPSVSPGMSAAVIGGGPIGNMVAQWLRLRGCDPVIVSEPDARKRELCSTMGLTVVDPTSDDPVASIVESTGGGADIVVEACGIPETFREALAAAGLFGQVVFLGNISQDLTIPKAEFSAILRRELTIYGAWNSKVVPRGADEWTRVLAMMDSRIDIEALISHRIALDEAGGMMQRMYARDTWFNKVIIEYPGGDA